jgi:non-heme chloroperoxidase
MTPESPIQPVLPPPRKSIRVLGADGVAIAAQAWGSADGPAVLLIHGFLGGRFSWTPLLLGPLSARANLITVELRGHGASDKPTSPSAYADGRIWAEDLAAVISAFELERFVLCAHSYGGVVALDYLRHKGRAQVAGLMLLAAAAEPPGVSVDHFHPDTIPALQGSVGEDLSQRVGAISTFVRMISRKPLPAELHDALIAQGTISSPAMVMGAFSRPPVSNSDVLARLEVPVVVAVGSHENVVTQALVDHVARTVSDGRSHCLDDVGHLPQIEATSTIEGLLAELIEAAARR